MIFFPCFFGVRIRVVFSLRYCLEYDCRNIPVKVHNMPYNLHICRGFFIIYTLEEGLFHKIFLKNYFTWKEH